MQSYIDFFMKKIKNELFSDNPGFLKYKVNVNFAAEQLPYFQICGTKDVFFNYFENYQYKNEFFLLAMFLNIPYFLCLKNFSWLIQKYKLSWFCRFIVIGYF